MTSTTTFTNERRAEIEFSATPGGYTKLWLVNMLLTLATLGIYGAWAKVRNNQYLYGHTRIEGHRLQYLATPKQILMGRMLALSVLLILVGVSMTHPMAAVGVYIALIVAAPWLIVQGLRFTYRNTAYRNVRFNFKGDYTGAFVNFILLPVLSAFTLFLALPWVIKRIHQFMFGNCEFGGERFNLNTSSSVYYKAAFLVFILNTLLMIVIFAGAGSSVALLASGSDQNQAERVSQMISGMIVPLIIAMYAVPYLVQAAFAAVIRNHVVNHLQADELARFHSEITVLGYMGVVTLNAIIILFTLGLAFPAAKVLKMRYLASKTTVFVTPRLDHMANTVDGKESAFGEEAAGLFDSDLSIV